MIEIKDYFGLQMRFGKNSILQAADSLEQLGGCCDGKFFSIVRCSGVDTLSYLNGQTSNQLNVVKSGTGQASSFNTPKGKTIALLDVFCFEKECFLIFAANASQRLLETLDMYLFSEDVNFDLQDSEGSLLFLGKNECEHIANKIGLNSTSEFAVNCINESFVFKGMFGKIPYVLIQAPLAKQQINQDQSLLSHDDLEFLRIQNLYSIPGVEYWEDKILTPELDQPHRINYQKGCFVGQEVFARLRTYGRTNKVLASICLEDCTEPAIDLIGKAVSIDEKSKGNVLASVRFGQETYLTAYVPTALKSLNDEVMVGEHAGKIIA